MKTLGLVNQVDMINSSEVTAETEIKTKQIEENITALNSSHRLSVDTNNNEKTYLQPQIECSKEDNGFIESFNRTKESLRHVTQPEYDNQLISPKHMNEYDESEADDNYVKIPVQQLINTFEKQMKSIIKQKINENIQIKMDNKKMSTTFTENDSYDNENESTNEQKQNQANENPAQSINLATDVLSEMDISNNSTVVRRQQTDENTQIELKSEYLINDRYNWQLNTNTSNCNSFQPSVSFEYSLNDTSKTYDNEENQSNGGKTNPINFHIQLLCFFVSIKQF